MNFQANTLKPLYDKVVNWCGQYQFLICTIKTTNQIRLLFNNNEIVL